MPLEIEWKVLEPVRIALLDEEFTKVLSMGPALVHTFVQRAVERSHSLALHVAIHCIRRVDPGGADELAEILVGEPDRDRDAGGSDPAEPIREVREQQ